MYRIEEIKKLAAEIGWRQHYDTTSYQIDSELTESASNQYYQDFHPLATLDNLKAISPDFDKIIFPTWSSTETYSTGSKILYQDQNYIALAGSLNVIPGSSPTIWKTLDLFSDWIKQETEALILQAVERLHSEKVAGKTALSVIENKYLFDGTGRIKNKLANSDSLVGFEIIPIRAKGVTLRIDRIGLQFSGPVENIDLYLMHSSQTQPVRTVTFTRTKDSSSEWFTPIEVMYLPYVSEESDSGGSWFLAYDQRALGAGVEAVIKDRDWSKGPCGDCSHRERADWKAWSKYLEIHPFRTKLDTPSVEMWDVTSNIYSYNTNYGMNLQVSVICDTSEIFLDQASSFRNVLGLQVVSGMIRKMAYNPDYRITRKGQNFSHMELLYELDGDSTSNKKGGILHRLNKAVEAAKIDLGKMSRICYSCGKKGVRRSAI